jgi:UDP-N-acetylmuramoyl-tripeptide--D-alanyl-D-alanine ligase
VSALPIATLTLAEVLAATGGALVAAPAGGPAAVAVASVSIDSRTLAPGDLFVAIRGPRFDGHAFVADAAARGAAAALVSTEAAAPAALPVVRVADTTLALAELARHVRRGARIPIVAVTGSVGKTTTKDMAARILETRGPVLRTEGNLNNRFGVPLTLLRLRPEHTAAVVEIGMSAPGEIRTLAGIARPDVAAITRISPVHLEFFPSVDAIAEAKAEIFDGLAPGGAAVLNGDDPRIVRIAGRFHGRIVWFGKDRRFDVSAGRWRGAAAGMRFDLRVAGETVDVALPLAGAHFVANFLAAAGIAHALGVSPAAMAETALRLAPAAHRGEVRALGEGVVLLDDCYNSSPDALEAAAAALCLLPGRRRVAVVGDMLELGPTGKALHRESGRSLAGRVDVVVGVGPLAAAAVDGAREAGLPEDSLHRFADAEAAAAELGSGIVTGGDAVLVKGSRGVRLEKVVDALVARFGEGRA